jgi:hypothetical protein
MIPSELSVGVSVVSILNSSVCLKMTIVMSQNGDKNVSNGFFCVFFFQRYYKEVQQLCWKSDLSERQASKYNTGKWLILFDKFSNPDASLPCFPL